MGKETSDELMFFEIGLINQGKANDARLSLLSRGFNEEQASEMIEEYRKMIRDQINEMQEMAWKLTYKR